MFLRQSYPLVILLILAIGIPGSSDRRRPLFEAAVPVVDCAASIGASRSQSWPSPDEVKVLGGIWRWHVTGERAQGEHTRQLPRGFFSFQFEPSGRLTGAGLMMATTPVSASEAWRSHSYLVSGTYERRAEGAAFVLKFDLQGDIAPLASVYGVLTDDGALLEGTTEQTVETLAGSKSVSYRWTATRVRNGKD